MKTCTTLNPVRWEQLWSASESFLDLNQLFFAKSDLRSAFKILPVLPSQRRFLIYKALYPTTGRYYWFVEKTLPFGASVSCAKFQLFSESLRHIVEYVSGQFFQITNYLDDFLFVARSCDRVNRTVRQFLTVCEEIGCPVALDKTEWGATQMVFLGILLNGRLHCLALPEEKITKAKNLLVWVLDSKKLTVKIIQKLTGTLNFLCKAIVPGRTFTRGMYDRLKTVDAQGNALKSYHHVLINKTFKDDCRMWHAFLSNASRFELLRPFVDISKTTKAAKLNFATDATSNPELGMGGILGNRWFFQKWQKDFMLKENPSINYLELYALVTAIFMWGDSELLSNSRISIQCDNQSVEFMINNMVGSCPHTMKLIRLLAWSNIKHNRRIFVRHITSKNNSLADALSRLEFDRFWSEAKEGMNPYPDEIPTCLWPMQKHW